MSITVVLTTIGRVELQPMLKSLEPQLSKIDFLYILVDGSECLTSVKNQLSTLNFACEVNLICEEKRLGHYGHALRNKYQKNLKGDYILHADDDDVYLKDSFEEIRKHCIYKDKIVFFRFIQDYKKKMYVWKKPILTYGDIGTPCGLIPNIPEKFGVWEYRHGGDFDFFNSCKFEHLFVEEFIYCVKPEILGSPKDYFLSSEERENFLRANQNS